jgi:putative aldouronate transport system substrate-binding protein
MKKRLLGLLLVALMLLPVLSSCTQQGNIVEKEVSIYTLYTIADATPEAVRAVELALNRILYYRINACIDIVAVSEKEYDELINKKIAEMDAIEAAKKTKGGNSSASSSSAANSDYVMTVEGTLTGEKVIQMLEEGKDIHPRTSRFDIFLVRGFDRYFELATQGKLAAINEKLSSDAKIINDYIHGSMISAATINKKLYGVPANGAIGDYKYIVFDEELLEKYNYNPKTMVTLDDLDEYLELIKKNEPDVVPLQSAVDTRDYSFMFEDGFPFYVDADNNVKSTYQETEIPTYYAKLARYNTLGYFSNAKGSNEGRFAVSFITGDESTIDEFSKTTGQKLAYNVYQNPVATNDSAVNNIYCVSKSVVSNELTQVAKLLAALFTDKEIQNILAYGVEYVTYALNDDGQVKMLNNDYKINRDYLPNKLLTYTLEGEDVKKWDKIKEQNRVSTASRAIGFEIVPKGIEFEDKSGFAYEPDYKAILEQVTAKYYPKFLNGSIVDIDLATIKADSEKAVMEELEAELTQTYESNVSSEYASNVRKQILSSNLAPKLKQEATETVMNELLTSVKGKLQNELTAKFKKELPGASDDAIQAKVDEVLTDEYVEEHLYDDTTKEKVEADINEAYESKITDEVSTKVSDYLASDAYVAAVRNAVNSAKFRTDLTNLYNKNGETLVNEKIDSVIAESIKEASEAMMEEYSTEIEAALNKFADDYAAKLKTTKEELFAKIEYYKEVASEDKNAKKTYEPAFESAFEFVYTQKIKKAFNVLYPLKTK